MGTCGKLLYCCLSKCFPLKGCALGKWLLRCDWAGGLVSGVWTCGLKDTWPGQGWSPNLIPKVLATGAAPVDLFPTLDPRLLLVWKPSFDKDLIDDIKYHEGKNWWNSKERDLVNWR